MLQINSVLNGKYRIESEIGHGGMSTVYKALDLSANRLLAVKEVDRVKSTDGQIVVEELSLKEGQLLKQLSNPHLPRIYDIIEGPTSFILVMDYILGSSLDKVIDRMGAVPENTVYEWGIQICKVLTYLHTQNPPIIYRDLKPSNMIRQPDGKLILIDFGTARTQKPIGQNNNLTADTVCMGTEGFAAPEQYGGMGQSDARTDIYCLGVTMYNMITGHNPQVEPKGVRSLQYWNERLGTSPLNDIIAKCTMQSPFDRYQTAEELMEDLMLAKAGKWKVVKGKVVAPSAWQRQIFKTANSFSDGLTGLLRGFKSGSQKSSSSLKKAEQPPQEQPPVQTAGAAPENVPVQQMQSSSVPVSKYQQSSYAGPNDYRQSSYAAPNDYRQSDYAGQPPVGGESAGQMSIWKKLMIFALTAAAGLLILSVMLIAIGATTPGLVMLIFGITATGLGIFGLIMNLKEKGQEPGSQDNA